MQRVNIYKINLRLWGFAPIASDRKIEKICSMAFFWKFIQWVLDKMKIMGAGCLVGMMLLTCVDVVGRAFGHPLSLIHI